MFQGTNSNSSSRAFTLIELLVVIVIIGVIATMSTIALTSMRSRARDSKRISDLKQIATTLELYYADHNAYPTTLTFGSPLVGASNGKTYMAKVPTNPTPRAEGACADLEYQYTGTASDFSLIGCLAKASGDAPAGSRKLEKGGTARDLGPTNGLIGWWMLDGINGSRDLSGNGYYGTLAGNTSTSTGRFGDSNGAYLFDGTGDFINMNTFPDGIYLDSMTSVCWVKLNSTSGSITIMNHGNQATSESYWWLWFSSNTLRFQYYHSYSTNGRYAELAFSDTSNWNMIAGTYDESDMKVRLYVNGSTLVTSSAFTPTTLNITTSRIMRIGGYAGGNTMNGYLSDCRLYNRALSSTEITALYNATKP
jgi:prepilin-type N-terminal cleavage/methylation domain-containing protein